MTVGTSTVLITGTAQVTVHAFFANLRTSTVSMTGTAQVTVHTVTVQTILEHTGMAQMTVHRLFPNCL